MLIRARIPLLLACAMGLLPAGGAPASPSARQQSAEQIQPQEASWAFGGPLPGAEPFEPEVVERLAAAWRSRDPRYQPRTRHLRPEGSPRYTNRLFLESSPYLLQHAHNPVDWRSWGDAAFAASWGLDRPVLLSIGYSTCHWCHVMEEESFEDEEIARYLNENYIVIKVDREERPDIDSVYLSAVRALGSRGGWPLTVWLTPDRKPFYGGTYFPARDGDRGRRTGFLTVLRRMKALYDSQPDRVAEQALKAANSLAGRMAPAAGAGLPGAGVLDAALASYARRFDPKYGGLQGQRKFPSTLPIRFLLRYHRRTGSPQALEMAVVTLERMAAGGIHDQVGGGFHRYATDSAWLTPHFEKMLYDNARLTLAYLEGYQVTGRQDFETVARRILHYVRRDMTSSAGAFYSATDADSLAPSGHREEGWFFTWTPEEIEAALGVERARVVNAYYAVAADGNFEVGRNILHTPQPLAEVAQSLGLPVERAHAIIAESRQLLYAARAERPPPLRDEKVLAAWNGLMVSAFSKAALVLGEPDYAQRAERAADVLLSQMRSEDRLLRSLNEGRVRHTAYLEDYAFVIAGLLDLYEATGRPRWIEEALALDGVLEQHYGDPEGGYFRTADDQEQLLVREKPHFDGAEPSGNSVQALNLLRLHEFTGDDGFRRRAEALLRAFGGTLSRVPTALSEMLVAVDFFLDRPKEILIVVGSGRHEAEPFFERLRAVFLPNRILVVAVEGEDLEAQLKHVPLLEWKVARDGRATAYVCEQRVCKLPTTDPEVFTEQIAKVLPRRNGK